MTSFGNCKQAVSACASLLWCSPGGLLKWNNKHSTFKQMAGIPFAAAPESPAAFFPRPLVAAILISWAALKQWNVKLTSAPLAVGRGLLLLILINPHKHCKCSLHWNWKLTLEKKKKNFFTSHTGDSNPCQYCSCLFSPTLYQLPLFHSTHTDPLCGKLGKPQAKWGKVQ